MAWKLQHFRLSSKWCFLFNISMLQNTQKKILVQNGYIPFLKFSTLAHVQQYSLGFPCSDMQTRKNRNVFTGISLSSNCLSLHQIHPRATLATESQARQGFQDSTECLIFDVSEILINKSTFKEAKALAVKQNARLVFMSKNKDGVPCFKLQLLQHSNPAAQFLEKQVKTHTDSGSKVSQQPYSKGSDASLKGSQKQEKKQSTTSKSYRKPSKKQSETALKGSQKQDRILSDPALIDTQEQDKKQSDPALSASEQLDKKQSDHVLKVFEQPDKQSDPALSASEQLDKKKSDHVKVFEQPDKESGAPKQAGQKPKEDAPKLFRIKSSINEHDLGIKVKKGHNLLTKGQSVKFIVHNSGEEKSNSPVANKITEEFKTDFKIKQEAYGRGSQITVYPIPKENP
ncbi:uncharacterized protein LOC131958330 [Physella acuta]|uniref:uncharacterized protein LOC131958330 n=1 Tax=Physella acuta TaxID=109671 RepID=UPI0027DDEA6B|nr:uncharacterized protein LOC131958330 [Physella acuta]